MGFARGLAIFYNGRASITIIARCLQNESPLYICMETCIHCES